MRWYEYGMYGMKQYVEVSINSSESFGEGNAAD